MPITVFPGIEVNVDKGHLLIIGEATDLDDFDQKAGQVSRKVTKIFEDGLQLSTGLNVLIGARSSGKTYTLDQHPGDRSGDPEYPSGGIVG